MIDTVSQVPDSELKLLKRRRPLVWLATAAVAAVVIPVLISMFTNERFRWELVISYLFDPDILAGLGRTLMLTAVSMGIAVVLGILLAVMAGTNNLLLNSISRVYIWIFRGTPVLVQILVWFNLAALYPTLSLGLPFGATLGKWPTNDLITPFSAAILGLALNEAAYMAEIVRAGLTSVDRGQHEAAQALGMHKSLLFRKIALPQAMRIIVPPTGNETINMLKNSALVSVIALPELLYSAQIIASQNFQVIPLLLVATIWYLVITSILTLIQSMLEKKFALRTHANTARKVSVQ